jgi:hypothetical protein
LSGNRIFAEASSSAQPNGWKVSAILLTASGNELPLFPKVFPLFSPVFDPDLKNDSIEKGRNYIVFNGLHDHMAYIQTLALGLLNNKEPWKISPTFFFPTVPR